MKARPPKPIWTAIGSIFVVPFTVLILVVAAALVVVCWVIIPFVCYRMAKEKEAKWMRKRKRRIAKQEMKEVEQAQRRAKIHSRADIVGTVVDMAPGKSVVACGDGKLVAVDFDNKKLRGDESSDELIDEDKEFGMTKAIKVAAATAVEEKATSLTEETVKQNHMDKSLKPMDVDVPMPSVVRPKAATPAYSPTPLKGRFTNRKAEDKKRGLKDGEQ